MIQDNEVFVIDDFIEKEYQEQIKNVLLGSGTFDGQEFPWYFIEDVTATGDPDSQHRPAMSHQYVEYIDDGDPTGTVASDFHEMFIPMLQRAAFKFRMRYVNALQGRSFLQFPTNKKMSVDLPHIDIYSRKHLVCLYYVCDSDGDTIIYNEREENKEQKYTIKQTVTPKQGRVVLFDGWLMHTAEQPINNVRCIVNYNLD
jgi:hypothetical protein